jgi:hypothetical protein
MADDLERKSSRKTQALGRTWHRGDYGKTALGFLLGAAVVALASALGILHEKPEAHAVNK